MKTVKGWSLPEWDNHYDTMMTKFGGTWHYQREQREYAFSYVTPSADFDRSLHATAARQSESHR